MGTAKIGIWGGSASGKTSFLAALTKAPGIDDDWHILPSNPNALDSLAEIARDLRRGVWPEGSTATTQYLFTMEGKKSRRFGIGTEPVSFTVFAEDRPGGDFLGKSTADFWLELASCDGLIYLFDPLLELKSAAGAEPLSFDPSVAKSSSKSSANPHNYDYLDNSIMQIGHAARSKGWIKGTTLNQFLAVCTTKFDHSDVFARLDGDGLIQPDVDEDGSYPEVPYVSDSQANDAFQSFAHEDIVRLVNRSFSPGNVKYFVTSAVGFPVDGRGQRVQRADCIRASSRERTRNGIKPINVIEPLIWVHSQVVKPKKRLGLF